MVPYARGSQPCSSTYFVTVMLSAQSRTEPSNIASTAESRRTSSNVPLGSAAMPEPTFADVDELVGPATPHFAYQLRARARPRPARGAPGAAVRRGEDGAARPARARLLEGRRQPSRAADAARLERAPELGYRRRAAAETAMNLKGASVLVT